MKTSAHQHHHQSNSKSSVTESNSTCSDDDSSSTTTDVTVTPVMVVGTCSNNVTFVTHDVTLTTTDGTTPAPDDTTPQLIPKPVKHQVMTSQTPSNNTKTSNEVTLSSNVTEAEARLSADNRSAVTAMAIFVSSAILLAIIAQYILINN